MGSKAERRAAGERVAAYHEASLATLIDHVAHAIDRYHSDELDAYDSSSASRSSTSGRSPSGRSGLRGVGSVQMIRVASRPSSLAGEVDGLPSGGGAAGDGHFGLGV
jgi:hypothetical protein